MPTHPRPPPTAHSAPTDHRWKSPWRVESWELRNEAPLLFINPPHYISNRVRRKMSFWALASRRVIPGTVQRSTNAAAAIGGTRQMSVAEKDNILPVSYIRLILFLCGHYWRNRCIIILDEQNSCHIFWDYQTFLHTWCVSNFLYIFHPIIKTISSTINHRHHGKTSSNAPPKSSSWPKSSVPSGSPEKSQWNPR